jgi:uncharacterized protein with NAD-binding domain and iron-sulfur cluster
MPLMRSDRRRQAGSAPGVTRRTLLCDAAAVGTAGVLGAPLLAPRAAQPKRNGSRRARRRVVILGGGVGGLTAAHELAERGFRVTLYEQGPTLGGKSRSIRVPDSGVGRRRDLPGEHGYRFFPGFYRHLPDTMRRIPYRGNARGVLGNLVSASHAGFARSGRREDLALPLEPPAVTPQDVAEAVVAGFGQIAALTREERTYFARKLEVFMTSSDKRRLGELERQSWWDFVGADRFSAEYRRFFASGITRQFAAAKPKAGSARTIGVIAEQVIFQNLLGSRGGYDDPDRVLNAPTSEAWLAPWVAELRRLGVRFRLRRTVRALEVRDRRIVGARVHGPGGPEVATGDWYVCALPVERVRRLWNPQMRAADPALARTRALVTAWMVGIQFYLNRQVPVIHGHVSYVDSPWALTSISQQQFWGAGHDLRRDGNGRVRDCLSVIISNWEAPGIVYGRPARRLGPRQIAREAWTQIQAHLNDTGGEVLTDDALESWFLDPAITFERRGGGRRPVARNETPLLINTVGSWDRRPKAVTRIPNLFLASDYVRTNIDLASMESANEAARRAVNGVLAESGSSAVPCDIFSLWQPPEFEPLKKADAARYARGQPHVLDELRH